MVDTPALRPPAASTGLASSPAGTQGTSGALSHLDLILVLLKKISITERSNVLAQTKLGKTEKRHSKTGEQELP